MWADECRERGNTTTSVFDATGRTTKVTRPAYQQPGGVLLTPSRTFTYNPTSRLLTGTTDWSGRTTSFEYDSFGRLARQIDPTQTGATTAPTALVYSDDLGRINRTVAPTGAERTTTFDDLGRTRTTTINERQPATVGTLTTTYSIDETTGTVSITDPTNATNSKIYNTLGQLTRQVDATGRGTDYLYDAFGRNTADFDAGHAITHDYYFDAASRLIRSSRYTTASGTTKTDFTYDNRGLVTAKTDGTGAISRMTYDARGLLTSLQEPVTTGVTLTTTLGYDAAGNNTRRTNAGSPVAWYTYNPWGQAESMIEPWTTTYPNAADRTFTTSYTADGDIATQTEPGGITRTLSYVTAGQLASVTSKIGAAPSAAITYGRDLNGRQTSATSGGSTISTVFNDRDLPVTVTNGGNVTNYTYNNASRVASRTDLAGTTSFTYDPAGRVSTLADPLSGLTTSYAYDGNGRTKTVTSGASTRALTYDQASRPLTDTLTSSSGAVLSTTNTWDNVDRLTTRVTGPAGVAGAGTETFTYDQASRLTGWTNQANVYTSYTWGPTGNRTSAGTSSFNYNERDQLQTATVSGVPTTYTYQPNGALATATTAGVTTARSYDGLGRLTQAGTATYTCCPLNRLTNSGAATLAYAGLETEPVNDSGVLYTRTPSGTINTIKSGGVASLAVLNGHGDLTATINPTTGTLVGRRTYDPYGAPIVTTTIGKLGYQSQWTDPNTNEVHTPARNYNPSTARFTTRDTWTLPLGTAAAMNRYTYANGNPINSADITGHNPIGDVIDAIDANGQAVIDAAQAIVVAAAARAAAAAAATAVASAAAMGIVAVGIIVGWQIVTTGQAGSAQESDWVAAENQDAYYQQTHGCGNTCGTNPQPPVVAGTAYTTSAGGNIEGCQVSGVTCYPNEPDPTNSIPTTGNRTTGNRTGPSGSSRPRNRPCVGLCPELPGPSRGTIDHDPRDTRIDGSTNPATSQPPIYTSDVTGDPKALNSDPTPEPQAPTPATQGNGAGHKLPPRAPQCPNTPNEHNNTDATNTVLFGQQSVSRTFTTADAGSTFKYAGENVADVATGLRTGSVSPNELPIEFVVRDGQRIAVNNRSLIALRRAGLNPTVTVDRTGDALIESRITERLAEMGGVPSSTIRVRGAGRTASYLDWLTC